MIRITQEIDRSAKRQKSGFLRALALVALLAVPECVTAETLPIKTYTIADGLARDSVSCILQDSHGFMWFCTSGGLSRFDGYAFTNYDTREGLPNNNVSKVLEARSGIYWVATADGIAMFNPDGFGSGAGIGDGPQSKGQEDKTAQSKSAKFLNFQLDDKPAGAINVLLQDREGTVWVGTGHGLYKVTATGAKWNSEFVPVPGNVVIEAILEDRRGTLWISSSSGIHRRWPDGRIDHYTLPPRLSAGSLTALLEGSDGRLWIGSHQGLCRLVADPDPSRPLVERLFTTSDGLPANQVSALFQSHDGTLWVVLPAPPGRMIAFDPAAPINKKTLRVYTTANGLSDKVITALAEDRDNNLWAGTESGGVMRITHDGFATFGETDGISQTRINSIFEDQAGELCVVGSMTRKVLIDRFDGRRFAEVPLDIPSGITWGWYQFVLQDHLGEWWIPTARGVYRFPATGKLEELAHLRPKAIYTSRDGLTADEVFRLFEDSHGDVWIGTITEGKDTLTRWERATGTFHRYSPADGIPAAAPTAFREDASGNLWIGFYIGGVARYRNGRFTPISVSKEPNGAGFVRSIYLDHLGRLWLAMSPGGAIRIDDPDAVQPHLVVYGPNEGLSAEGASSIAEDRWGRIYIGTGRGLDRLDPVTGEIQHYTTADGLAQNLANISFRDRQGTLWFGTLHGLSRLVPEPDANSQPPPILIGGLRIAGVQYPISDLGESEVKKLELNPDQNQVQIDFFSLSFRSGESLRYEYMLAGADRDWSAPTNQRSLNYANLKPGSYRFMVRAVNAEGLMSQLPATFAFVIDPPIWERWWFLTLAALFIVGCSVVVQRYRAERQRERSKAADDLRRSREERLRELERVRKRIASDLHDDVGSSLTQISLLSEVLRQRIDHSDTSVEQPLEMIATSSRDLVDAMSDIVWATNPQKDHLSDLSLRMRSLASDVFTLANINFSFTAPADESDIVLGANLRREVFLIFKESINNIVKHSGAMSARIEFQVEQHQLLLMVNDNGRGFDLNPDGEGHGLTSMRARSDAIGGSFNLVSADGKGTTVTLRAPLRDGTSGSGEP